MYSILNLSEINTQEIAGTAKEDAVLFFWTQWSRRMMLTIRKGHSAPQDARIRYIPRDV